MSFVRIEDLHKTYYQSETAIHILQGASCSIAKGETAAIVGQSGSGKSTFLSLVAGLDSPDKGTITVDDASLEKMNEDQLGGYRRDYLGIVFQQFHLLEHLTAIENICLPLQIRNNDSDFKNKAKSALSQVGLEHRADHYPSQLSGGERQRVAIARAFICQPKLLLADEPSGNLDNETGESVMGLLFEQVKQAQMTMMLVTHNDELASQCDHIFRLERGTLRKC